MTRRAVVATVAIALAAACSPSTERSDAPGPTTTTTEAPASTTSSSTTTTTWPLAPVDPATWAPCGDGFDCATVAVPIDHADPDGPRLDVALVRRPAGDPAARIGALLVNPGGPGASGTARVRRGFVVSDEVAARFDIIGFDPRGVGDSGSFDCADAVERFRSADLDPDTPAEHQELESAARDLAATCREAAGDLLPHLGTIDVARDVELIRRALGEDQVSYVGLSYGTLIGLLWADGWPMSARALVLDAVVDPAAQWGGASVDQAVAVDEAVAAIDAACAEEPACPVADTGGVLAAYDLLAERLEVEPEGGVGPTRLAYAAIMATYDPELRPRLWDALAAGLDGDLGGVASLADRFTALVDYPLFAAVSCLDAPHAVGYRAWTADGDALAERSPRFGRVIANELLPCAFWPPATLDAREVTVAGGPPVLVIGSTGDVATPFDQAERVATTLDDGHLLEVASDRHVSLSWSDCAREVATRYLVDGALPAPGERCED